MTAPSPASVRNLVHALEAYDHTDPAWAAVVDAAANLTRHADTDPAAADLTRLLADIHNGKRAGPEASTEAHFLAIQIGTHTNGTAADQDDTGAPKRTTWWPVPFTETPAPPIEPAVLRRSDGVPMFYAARLNAVIGESEGCKTWFAYVAVKETVDNGGHVLIVDFEDIETTCEQRLAALGVTRPQLAELVHFLHPQEPLLDRGGRATRASMDLDEVLRTWPLAYAMVDGVTEGMSLEGFDPLDNGEVAHWYRAVPKRIAGQGAATTILDHVTKDREQRGRYALGGVHKLNGLDGAGYILEPLEPFAPGHTGRVKITVAKDRGGYVRARSADRKRAGILTLQSFPDGGITSHFDPEHDQAFEPTALMEKVSRHLELYPGDTKTELRKLGNSDYVDLAIRLLVERHHIAIRQDGRAHRHDLTDPYRQPDADDRPPPDKEEDF